uniref:Cytochrome P450 n=2 Tax=Ditylum brightwellii TaxID=49249 RepID=A0A7S4R0T7_9STRA|mmetsp:Transcript_58092/g.86346  ORF Transcript_58092/g.86346 Transcript_58092/m.86346 type:complete len:203 (+) Transcript_58092:439-1047(+)
MAQHAEDWPEESIRLSNKFGKTWGGPYPVNKVNTCLFMVDEASIRHVLSENSNNYEKGDGSRSFFRELLGNGIFLSDGDQWFVHRKIMSKMFSRNLLRRTSEVIQMKLEQIASLLLNAMETEEQYVGSAEPRISLDLQDIFFRMTFDVTSFVALGCEIDSIGTYGAEGGQHPFAEAFGQMQEAILVRPGNSQLSLHISPCTL